MKKVKGVKRYAKQLLSAIDLNEAPKVIEQFSAVAVLMDRDKGFRNIMVSPAFSAEETAKVVDHLAKTLGMSEKAAKFLAYISVSGVIVALPQIVSAIKELYLDMKKRSRAVVTTPVEIGAVGREKLAASLKKISGRDVDIEYVMDPSLLGGVSIKVGSTMYDSSIKGQLGLLKDKLIKG